MLTLKIIKDQEASKDQTLLDIPPPLTLKIREPQQVNKLETSLDAYSKLVSFIHDPKYIRINSNDSVKTMILGQEFNRVMNECVAYKNSFPKLMSRLILEYPNLLITKKVKNYGTVYQGIGLSGAPSPCSKKIPLTRKEIKDNYNKRQRLFADQAQQDICQRCNWTTNQYRQMGNLSLIELAKDGKMLNIEATIYLIMARLVLYIREKNLKLTKTMDLSLSIKIAFEKALELDAIASKENNIPVYTNRLVMAKETYKAGEKLRRALASYMNTMQNLPILDFILYPNMEEISVLINWLKNNSLFKTQFSIKIQQRKCSTKKFYTPNWTLDKECNINTLHCPKCNVINCQNIAYFIDPEDAKIYPIRCHIHKFHNDIELVKKLCIDCEKESYFPENRQSCMNCGKYCKLAFWHFKEFKIKYLLQSNGILFIHDKIISLFGSRKRPDFLIQSNFGYIILEVDEGQHKGKGYTKEEETNRMQILNDDVKLLNPSAQVLFIRYNPDKYVSDLQHSSEQRLYYLYNLLIHFIGLPNIGISVGKLTLYYDGFNGNPEIDPTL